MYKLYEYNVLLYVHTCFLTHHDLLSVDESSAQSLFIILKAEPRF